MPKTKILVIDLGDGEPCRLSPRMSAAILAAARRRKRSVAHIVGLALRRKIRIEEEERAEALAKRLGCSRREASERAVTFLLTYLKTSQIAA